MTISAHHQFTVIMEKDGEWFFAYCAEIPGANGQGKTEKECLENLKDAVELLLEDKKEDVLKSQSKDAKTYSLTFA